MAIAIVSPSSSEPDPPAAATAIRLQGVSKRFRKYTLRRGAYTTLKSSVVNRMFRRRFPPENYQQALRDIDIEVPIGTTLGIIGANGSGKSTLLKVMAGIIRPDSGTVEVRGRISPLIELGTGFHPEFSGRENIYLNALVLGMSKHETEERYESIVEFAGLADCIDDPVRTYSSGMYMRLGFSVAIHVDPDVLLIDEILAVGDESFVTKCRERLSAHQAAGKTIVFVSHSLEQIERWCHEAIWIDRGRIVTRGTPATVTRLYHVSHEPVTTPAPPVVAPDEPPPLRDSLNPGRLHARIRAIEPFVTSGENHRILARALLEVENLGDTVWRAMPPTRRGMIMIGGRLQSDGRYLAEVERALLPRDVYPGETALVEYKFPLPGPGDHRIAVDLVDEEICWFADGGSEPLLIELSA